MQVSTQLAVAALAVMAVNNLGWYYYHAARLAALPPSSPAPVQDGRSATDHHPAKAQPAPVQAEPAGRTAMDVWLDRLEAGIALESGSREAASNSREMEDLPDGGLPSPLEADTPEMDVGIEQREATLSEMESVREHYYAYALNDRLQVIESLAATSNDLVLLADILQREDEPALRAAAVSRLAQSNNHVATRLALNALDDPALDVQLSALHALAATGDRSLVPLLRERLAASPAGDLQEQMRVSITRIERSGTMDMDGLADLSTGTEGAE